MQRIGNESTVDIGLLSAVLKVRGAGGRLCVKFSEERGLQINRFPTGFTG